MGKSENKLTTRPSSDEDDLLERAELGRDASTSDSSAALPSTSGAAPSRAVAYKPRGIVKPGPRRPKFGEPVKAPAYRSSRNEAPYHSPPQGPGYSYQQGQSASQIDVRVVRKWLGVIAGVVLVALVCVLLEQYAAMSVEMRVVQANRAAMEKQLDGSKLVTQQINSRVSKLRVTIQQLRDKCATEMKRATHAAIAEYDQTVNALRTQVGLSMRYLEKNRVYTSKLEKAKVQVRKMELISSEADGGLK